MQELTPWFDGRVKPARVGVYERDILGFGPGQFTFWNGLWWGLSFSNDNPAVDRKRAESSEMYGPGTWQDAPWRGLAKEPK